MGGRGRAGCSGRGAAGGQGWAGRGSSWRRLTGRGHSSLEALVPSRGRGSLDVPRGEGREGNLRENEFKMLQV